MEAVFIKVLNMSISACWLILVVILLRLLLKKAPKWISVVLWGIVGLRLVLPFSLQSVFSLIPSAEVVSPSIGYAQHPEINSGVSVIDNVVNPTLGTSLAATPMNSVNPMQIVLYLGGLVWVGGIAILLLYGLVSYLRLRHKVVEAIPYEKNTWLCDQVKTPFILGVFRPRIYLPTSLNEEETAYVLAHERAHLKRKDHLWKPLGFLLLTVYWFNPLVWVAYILLCRDIEAACDEKVISDMEMSEKKAYANALVSCSMQRRLILACPLAFGEVGVKERVKGVLNYRKPAFWIIVAALIACVVIAVCFLTNPKDDGPDLSFLNYKNAISLIGQNDTAPHANLYPADSDGVQPGVADSKALAQFLESAEWTKRRAPSSSPEPRGYLEFVIEDDYRIIVYQSELLAAVRFGNEIRYYRTRAGDYEAALATFIPAPSTEPDRPPEQSALPTPVPPPNLPEIDAGIVPADPEAFLLGFADAEIVSIYDEFSKEYAAPDISFTEIISAETWTAHAFNEFPASIALRLIVMRSGDWELRIEDDGEDCLFAAYAVERSASDPIIFFDCGENLMDDLMAWAITRQDGAHSGPMPYKLTAEEEEQIVYMLSEVAGKTGPYALSDHTGGDMNAVPELCMQLQYYARGHRLSVDELRGLMLGTENLDGAYAEGYAALLAELHTLDPLRFVVAYFRADETVRPFLYELYGLGTADPPEELLYEHAVVSQIYSNCESILRLQYGIEIPPMEELTVTPVKRFVKEEVVNWVVSDPRPIWLALVPLSDGEFRLFCDEEGIPQGMQFREADRAHLLSVTSGGVTIVPYSIMRFSETWTEYGQVAADGIPIELEFAEHAEEIPALRLDGELRVQMPEDTSALTFYLLDGLNGNQLISETLYNGKRLESPVVARVSRLEGLAPGKYLCYFDFLRACISNETEGLFDRLGDNCYFWLEIPEQ